MTKVTILEDWNRFFPGVPSLEALRARVDLDIQHDRPIDRSDLLGRIGQSEVVVLNRERSRFDGALIGSLPNLRLIVQTGGLSPNVDSAAATEHGIALSAAPGVPASSDGVGELAIGLLIGLARQIPANDRAVRVGNWDVAPTRLLNGSTVGILGLGRIGRSIARIAQAMQMLVIAHGPTLTPERATASGAEFVSLDDLFTRSDAVFICPRLSDLTRGLVMRRHIDSMKASAYLINIARGPIVDESALIDALHERRIAGAGLDVFDTEPLPRDHPLIGFDNVILTPHIGWVMAENTRRFVDNVVDRITRFLDGDDSQVINHEALAARRMTNDE